jgi:phosphoribosyl 1,2-cyclic phosphodiesterase
VEALVLASGSSGNAVVVRSGENTLLVDVGVSARQIRRRMEQFGVSPDELDAVVLTHEHSDHVRGLEVFSRRYPLPVWASSGTWSRLRVRTSSGGELRSGSPIHVGCLRVLPVSTSHDAADPVAFLVDDGDHRLALCTDTGVVTHLLEQRLRDSEVLLIEANHDADMLRHGPYPWPLKQRIASRLGHLANHQTEEALSRIGTGSLKAVVGMHLSEQNNRPDLVIDSLGGAAGSCPVVDVVTRWEMLRITVNGDSVTTNHRELPR